MAFVSGAFGNAVVARNGVAQVSALSKATSQAAAMGPRRSRGVTMQLETDKRKQIDKVVKESPLNVNQSGSGTFGFSALAEQLNGRAAMFGFAAALIGEITTGKSLFKQMVPGMEPGSSESFVFLFAMVSLWTFTSIGYVALKKSQQIDSLSDKNEQGENF